MYRECSHCHRPFTIRDFARAESKGMEADRRAVGLEGVRFFSYHCQVCSSADIFVDLHHLPGESDTDYQARREELQAVVQQRHGRYIEAVLSERPADRPLCGASGTA